MSQSTVQIADWVRQTVNDHSVTLDQIPGGGSRTSYVVRATGGKRYLLRVDNGEGPLSGTQFTIEREFRVISALHAAALPVPGIFAYSERHNAMLMEFIEGTTSYQVKVTPEQQLLIQYDLIKNVVALHRLDVAMLGLSRLRRPADDRCRSRQRPGNPRVDVSAQVDSEGAGNRFRPALARRQRAGSRASPKSSARRCRSG